MKAIIFDIDGTLVESVDLHAKAWQEAFENFGKHLEFQAVRDQIGKGGDELLPTFLSNEEIEQFGDDSKTFRGVGDSPFDAEAAKKAHMQTIGFLSGGFAEQKLVDAGVAAIYDGPEDLLAQYQTSPIASHSAPA